jgi:hypothetical protein
MTDTKRLRDLEHYARLVYALIANDALAATYVSIGAYRRGMLKAMRLFRTTDAPDRQEAE